MSAPDSPFSEPTSPLETVAWNRGHAVSLGRLVIDARRLAGLLPAGRQVINLCEGRYSFLVAFTAALLSNRESLLPPSRLATAVAELRRRFPDAAVLVDSDSASATQTGVIPVALTARQAPKPDTVRLPRVEAHAAAARVFTSGTTGVPIDYRKTWGSLVDGARSAIRELELEALRGASLLATVPAQHMFGLEFQVVLPLIAGVAVSDARPLLPADVAAALAKLAEPRILITTPVQLRAFMQAKLEWPRVAVAISSTAPLDPALARQTEETLGGRVEEIYGSTETGAIASRRTAATSRWRLFAGLDVRPDTDGAIIGGGHLAEPAHVADRILMRDERHFELVGRHQDLIKVAGKRASLGDLNRVLLAVPGVEDGVVFLPDGGAALVTRLAALVVAPSVSEQRIAEHLSRSLDSAFLPRPIYRVDRLPRTEIGKLRREDLLAVLRRCRDRP